MNQIHFSALLLVLCSASIFADETPQRLVTLDESFQREINRETQPLEEKYLAALETLQRTFSKSGNLDAALVIKAEIERTEKNEPKSKADSEQGLLPELKGLQASYSAAIERKVNPILERYKAALTRLQQQYTSGNDLEAAVLVRNRLDQLAGETTVETAARVTGSSGAEGSTTTLKDMSALGDWLQTRELYWQGNNAGVILRFSGDEVLVFANGSEIFRREYDVEDENVFTFPWSSDDLNTFTLSPNRETFERKMEKNGQVMQGKVRDR